MKFVAIRWGSGDSRSEQQGGQSSRMNVGLRRICWHNKEHNGLVYYASIMLAYWVDNIKYRSILSNRTVGVSTLVNCRWIFSNRTVTVKLSRGGHGSPLESPMRWGIFHGTQVREVNVCIHTLAKLLAINHYEYNSTSTKQEIDQTPGPVQLARSSLACH